MLFIIELRDGLTIFTTNDSSLGSENIVEDIPDYFYGILTASQFLN